MCLWRAKASAVIRFLHIVNERRAHQNKGYRLSLWPDFEGSSRCKENFLTNSPSLDPRAIAAICTNLWNLTLDYFRTYAMEGYKAPRSRTKLPNKRGHRATQLLHQRTPTRPPQILITTWTLAVPKSTIITTTGPTFRGFSVRQPNSDKWDISSSNSNNSSNSNSLGRLPGQHQARTIPFLRPSMRMLTHQRTKIHLLFNPKFKVSLDAASPQNPPAMEPWTLELKTLSKLRTFLDVTRCSEKMLRARIWFPLFARKLASKNRRNSNLIHRTLSCVLGTTFPKDIFLGPHF